MLDSRLLERRAGRPLTAGETLKAALSGLGIMAGCLALVIGLLTGLGHIAARTPHAQAEARWEEDQDRLQELISAEALSRHHVRLETAIPPEIRHSQEAHPTIGGELKIHYLHLTYQLQPAGAGTLEADYVHRYLSRRQPNPQGQPPTKVTTLQDRYVDLNSLRVKRNRPHRPARAQN